MANHSVTLTSVGEPWYQFLYELATSEEIGFRWRLAGSVPSEAEFVSKLWQGVFAQSVVISPRKVPIGLVQAYNVDLNHGYGSIAGIMTGPYQRRGYGIQAFLIFIEELFRRWNFRKLYVEVPEFNVAQVMSGIDGILPEEARLVDHVYYAGQFWDLVTYAIYRGADNGVKASTALTDFRPS